MSRGANGSLGLVDVATGNITELGVPNSFGATTPIVGSDDNP